MVSGQLTPKPPLSLILALAVLIAGPSALGLDPTQAPFPDATGTVQTVSTISPTASIDLTNAFFQDIGANGRACGTCHRPEDAWSITPSHIQQRFDKDGGLEPLFRPNDGSVCTDLDVSTVDARRAAYRLLLAKGLIRIAITVPTGASQSHSFATGFAGAMNRSQRLRAVPISS
jgi:hypothetical protein